MKIDYKEFVKVIQYKMADIQKFLNDIEVKNEEEKSMCIVSCMTFEDMILKSFKGNIKD